MPIAMRISVQGIDELHERFNRINPQTNPAWISRGLVKAGMLTQKIAAEEKIKRGGAIKAKGGMRAAAPIAGKLTSRSGMLRRSIRLNRTPLPWAIEIGTDLVYGAVHEKGGVFHVGSYTRMLSYSTRSGASSAALVKAHTRKYPPRPFLGPGLEKAAKSFERIFTDEWAKEMP